MNESVEEKKAKRLTERDRQLVGLMAVARYLSTEQVRTLIFPERDESVARKRLAILAGEGTRGAATPLVRRLVYRAKDWKLVTVWAPTVNGYYVAMDVLGSSLRIPAHDVAPEFLGHTIALNDLFVRLMATGDKHFARARVDRFAWRCSDSVRLPWTEYDMRAGKRNSRVIHPDAVLELPGQRRRIFIECETGSQPIASVNDDKGGATVAKIQRYESFLRGFADVSAKRTHYAEQFPDGFAPEVLFLVFSNARRESINKAIAAHTARGASSCRFGAMVIHEASSAFRVAPGTPTAVCAAPVLTGQDMALLHDYFTESVTAMKAARNAVREVNKILARPLEVPQYPRTATSMRDLVVRLVANRNPQHPIG